MESLGQELKKERQARNISIDEMSSSTKIVGRYLEALEQDRFDAMPGGFFVKGIVRAYAKYVGLDANEILERYRQAGVFDEPDGSRTTGERFEASFPVKRKLIVGLIVGLGIVLVLVALMFLWKSRRPRPVVPPPEVSTVLPQARPASTEPEKKAEVAPGQPSEAAPETKATSAPGRPETRPGDLAATPAAAQPAAQEPAPAQQLVQAESKGLAMDIAFQEETWIQIYGDGALKVGGLFPPGRKIRLQAEREILIYVGNAGGLTYVLNGQPGKSLGRSGEVLNNVRITLDNLKDFQRERQPAAPSD
jgi:cytoskeleton protein RodZ